jgi:hypothetical protein
MITKICSFLAGLLIGASSWAATDPGPAALRERYTSLRDALANNQYKRPIHIESSETSGTLKGDIYALVEHPYGDVSEALTSAAPWCDIMIMPINTKACRVAPGGKGLTVMIGRKADQPLKDAFPIEFAYRVAQNSPDYVAVRLDADTGPVGTHDYRVFVEATPIENGKTFLHLRYSYGYGMAGKLAMQAYLATAGAGKVGFSSTGGQLTGGMRGVVERNTMRYYLAIDAYLDAVALPASQRLERRLATWFDATEQYKRQLHEVERDDYLSMKRREVQRQQTAQESSAGPAPSGQL